MRGFVGRLRRQDFPCRRYPSYAASIFYRLRIFTLWFHGYLQASLVISSALLLTKSHPQEMSDIWMFRKLHQPTRRNYPYTQNVEEPDRTSSRLHFRPVHHRSTFFRTCGGGGCGVFSGRGKGSGRTTATLFVASFFAFFFAPVFSGRVAF